MRARSCLLAGFVGLLFVSMPEQVSACSFSWKQGNSPREIKHRGDVRRIEGTFRIVDIRGTVDEDGSLDEGMIYGRIETRRGKSFDTVQNYSQFLMMCGADKRPVKDGSGIYWVMRKPKDGKYKMMLWEGEYSDTQTWTGSRK